MFLPVSLLLIAGLASDDFATREVCQEALSLCPQLAEPVVWWYFPDPEVNHRLQVIRQDYDPPWLLGEWKVSSDTGMSFSILIKPHGQAQFWYETYSPKYSDWCTWYYSGDSITLKSSAEETEVYRLKRGKRWTTAVVPGEVSCWWTQGKKILRTRRSFIYPLNR
jgi:hypothetical protein